MHHFDSTLSGKAIAECFNQTLEIIACENPDEMSPEAFCEMMIERRIGGYGKDFMTDYLDHLLNPKNKLVKDGRKTNISTNIVI